MLVTNANLMYELRAASAFFSRSYQDYIDLLTTKVYTNVLET